MKYEIINNDVAIILNEMYTEEYIEKTLDSQFKDASDFIAFNKEYPNSNFIYVGINVYKKFFKKKIEYNPNEWNKFPEVEPPNSFDFYLVYKKYPETNNFRYTVDYWDPENKKFTQRGNDFVVAFRKFEPCKE